MEQQHVDAVELQPFEALLERPHRAVVAEVEDRRQAGIRGVCGGCRRSGMGGLAADAMNDVTGGRGDPARVAIRERLAQHRDDLRPRRGRADEPADLRRDDDLVTRKARQDPRKPPLGEAAAVLGRGVEQAQAEFERSLHQRLGIVVPNRFVQPPEGHSSEPHPGHL